MSSSAAVLKSMESESLIVLCMIMLNRWREERGTTAIEEPCSKNPGRSRLVSTTA